MKKYFESFREFKKKSMLKESLGDTGLVMDLYNLNIFTDFDPNGYENLYGDYEDEPVFIRTFKKYEKISKSLMNRLKKIENEELPTVKELGLKKKYDDIFYAGSDAYDSAMRYRNTMPKIYIIQMEYVESVLQYYDA